ncbi:MAG: DUF1345 domain-containing protein [Phenylobacterium sp.]|uniref:DUF1345 domain-containing protein n=1 Tax=Phenylobacterium sp. TaxID=1871053 RepID=UPI003BB62874
MARKAAAQPPAREPRKRRPVVIGAFLARPRLLVSFAVGLAVWLACASLTRFQWSTSAIFGWDATALVFIVALIAFMIGKSPADIRRQASAQDQGQGVILAVVVLAAAFSIAAVGVELSTARGGHGLEQAGRVALAFGTVAASWFMVHLIFALHYAHEYYAPEAEPTGKAVAGGLAFPGGEEPDYWDFVHFSTVIGVAAQTADIAFTSKPLRRIGTIHGIVAFTFNTVVLALTINLLAGLFGGG